MLDSRFRGNDKLWVTRVQSKMKTDLKSRAGFTLVELMVTIVIASIVLLGIGYVLVDAHRGYNKMFTRVHGDIVNQAHEARVIFDKICRQSSRFYKIPAPGPANFMFIIIPPSI